MTTRGPLTQDQRGAFEQSAVYEAVIGLEVHCQLALASKLFSSVATASKRLPVREQGAESTEANTLVDEVTLALPGSLPVVNEGALRLAALLGYALGCSVELESVFARKHYFYPDLPKGYQITQYDRPICRGGVLLLCNGTRVRIDRIQIEEDAGKTLHESGESLVDFNRAGVALVEIVSEPDMRSAAEAVEYFRRLHRIAVYHGVTDGDLERGNFRADANVSIRRRGESAFGTRTEIKNLNSFRFLERAIELEIKRQIECLDSGGIIEMETRGYDAGRDTTFRMRSKEEAHDYRYFPDPDLPPAILSAECLAELKASLRRDPFELRDWLELEVGLSRDDADRVSCLGMYGSFFEKVCRLGAVAPPKFVGSFLAANLFLDDFPHRAVLEKDCFARWLAEALEAVEKGQVAAKILKDQLPSIVVLHAQDQAVQPFEDWCRERGLLALSDESALDELVSSLLGEFPKQVEELRAGKTKLLSFFVGQGMKRTQGRLDAARFRSILLGKLGLPPEIG